MININIVNIAYNFLFTVQFAFKSFCIIFGSALTDLERKSAMFMKKLLCKLYFDLLLTLPAVGESGFWLLTPFLKFTEVIRKYFLVSKTFEGKGYYEHVWTKYLQPKLLSIRHLSKLFSFVLTLKQVGMFRIRIVWSVFPLKITIGGSTWWSTVADNATVSCLFSPL